MPGDRPVRTAHLPLQHQDADFLIPTPTSAAPGMPRPRPSWCSGTLRASSSLLMQTPVSAPAPLLELAANTRLCPANVSDKTRNTRRQHALLSTRQPWGIGAPPFVHKVASSSSDRRIKCCLTHCPKIDAKIIDLVSFASCSCPFRCCKDLLDARMRCLHTTCTNWTGLDRHKLVPTNWFQQVRPSLSFPTRLTSSRKRLTHYAYEHDYVVSAVSIMRWLLRPSCDGCCAHPAPAQVHGPPAQTRSHRQLADGPHLKVQTRFFPQ